MHGKSTSITYYRDEEEKFYEVMRSWSSNTRRGRWQWRPREVQSWERSMQTERHEIVGKSRLTDRVVSRDGSIIVLKGRVPSMQRRRQRYRHGFYKLGSCMRGFARPVDCARLYVYGYWDISRFLAVRCAARVVAAPVWYILCGSRVKVTCLSNGNRQELPQKKEE